MRANIVESRNRGPSVSQLGPCRNATLLFLSLCKYRGLANGLQIPRKALFRSYRFESVRLRGADETAVNQTVSSRREREFSLKVE